MLYVNYLYIYKHLKAMLTLEQILVACVFSLVLAGNTKKQATDSSCQNIPLPQLFAPTTYHFHFIHLWQSDYFSHFAPKHWNSVLSLHRKNREMNINNLWMMNRNRVFNLKSPLCVDCAAFSLSHTHTHTHTDTHTLTAAFVVAASFRVSAARLSPDW